jgi:hypothetical protein
MDDARRPLPCLCILARDPKVDERVIRFHVRQIRAKAREEEARKKRKRRGAA